MERIRICQEETKETVGYDLLVRENPFDKPLIDGYVNLIVEVMCSEGESFRIGRSQRPLEEIQDRFAQLDYEHLSYVLGYYVFCGVFGIEGIRKAFTPGYPAIFAV